MSVRIPELVQSVWREVAVAAKAAPAIYFAPLVGAVKEVKAMAKGK
ncbi:hypothetical protein [Pseudomonas aeruginosa]|nr:hypothetical protein [Pseudomonas aeruginosa]